MKSGIFLDYSTLESAGFYHIDALDFRMLIRDDTIFLLNYQDNTIARFRNGKLEKTYTANGQGPGEFIYPRNVFLFDNETLAVFDTGRVRVILFNLDLDFIKEIKVGSNIRKLVKFEDKVVAFGDFGRRFLAVLDRNFKIIETFGEIPGRMPFSRIFRQMLYMGYFIDDRSIASTSWLYFKTVCKVDIVDLSSKDVQLSFTWKHPVPPTQKSIDAKKNFYGSYYVGRHGDFYLVQNALSKRLLGERIIDTMVFDSKGKLLYKGSFPYFVVTSYGSGHKLFFVDNHENIRCLSIKDLIDGSVR